MNYKVLYDHPNESLIERLLKVRNVKTSQESFLNPSIWYFRRKPELLSNMTNAVERILLAIKKNEKIMIFGDYDVDGITSSYTLYSFFKKFMDYKHISIMYPHRRKDWYGIKNNHIDKIKKKWVSLIITVDNWISAIQEAIYCKNQWIDLIVTDHHKDGDEIPKAFAVINPHTSPEYDFKGLCWAGVVFKLINAIMQRTITNSEKKKEIFNYFLPIVAIATVADCVPLIDENRAIVKRWLELINQWRMPVSLKSFIDFLKISGKINTFHIGFMIWPRINAGGRIKTPYDSLYTLLYEGTKQQEYLEQIEEINTERKKLQEDAYKIASKQVRNEENILIAYDKTFHEWVVGIVAWRLTEEYNKPTLVMYINEEENIAVGSLRGPWYFNVIEMLQSPQISWLLEKFWWHQQAWGLTIKLKKLEKLIQKVQEYGADKIKKIEIQKTINIDTKLHERDIHKNELRNISKLEPFGIWNEEPVFLVENYEVEGIEKIGRNGNWHIKLHWTLWKQKIQTLLWRKWAEINNYKKWKTKIIGKIQEDNYKWGRYLEWKEVEQE